MMGFGMGFGWILGLVVLGLAFWLFMEITGSKESSGKENPLDILRKRYARGDINHDQYEQMKKDLQH